MLITGKPNGFHLIDAMSKEEKHSARYHVKNITTPICQRLNSAGKRKLVIHPDNSRCHTAKVIFDFVSQRKVRFAPYPPDSPDIAPSDFFLFGYLKRELRGSRVQTGEALLVKIRKLVSETHLKLYWTFSRLDFTVRKLIANDGNYFEYIIKL
jgi:hypothetical protein